MWLKISILIYVFILSQKVESKISNNLSPFYSHLPNQPVHKRYFNPMQKSRFDTELEELLNDLEDDEDTTTKRNQFLPIRDKKDKYNELPTCPSKFKHEPNVIVDSKASIKNGAELINPIRYITKETAKMGLNALHNNCIKMCCDNENCDTALLSMKIGLEGYRCYLFKCNENCFFIKHSDYVVLKMRSPEQLNNQAPLPLTKPSLKTDKPKQQNDFNAEMMGAPQADKNSYLISNIDNENKIYFTDEANAITPSKSVTLAVVLLVFGISIVMMMFVYMVLSTKYINKRIGRVKNKNVDVDGDYLINGMYL